MKVSSLVKGLKKLPKPAQTQAVAWGLGKAKEQIFKKRVKKKKRISNRMMAKRGGHIQIQKIVGAKKKIKMAKRRGYRASARGGGWKEKARKFFAGVGTKKVLGGGILGLGASYFVADFEGVAGNLVGEQLLSMLSGLTGTTGNTSGNGSNAGDVIGGGV